MASDKKASVSAAGAAGWTVAAGTAAGLLLQTMSEVGSLFDLRLGIKILFIVAVAASAFALAVRGQKPGVATRAAWGVAGIAAVAALGFGLISGFEILSLDEQIADVRKEASRDGKRVLELTAGFRGGEAESRVFYFEDEDLYAKVFGAQPPLPSGEIRIYDVRDGDLSEAFRFQPEGGKTAVFRYRFLGDLDRDGDDELIGGFGRPQEHSEALLPFAIFWDDALARYKITSLQDGPPDRHVKLEPRPGARELHDGYRERVTFQDESEGLSITGYRVQDFAVTKAGLLISALAVDMRSPTRIGEVELAVNQIRLSDNEPRALPCRLRSERPIRAEWPSDRALHRVLAERWSREDSFCQPIFPSR